MAHRERHKTQHIGWLRAAVLGANDGILSTASLIVGVASSNADHYAVVVAGMAGLVAGAMSMAAGEYVSVSSQADTEKADISIEKIELSKNIEAEKKELADIYIDRGLEPGLAREVAEQLMAKDALGAHARDELGISEVVSAKPVQAAFVSAASFAVGAALPMLVLIFAPISNLVWFVSAASLVFLGLLGAVAARTGGSNVLRGAMRVTFWGAVAMAATAIIGMLFGTKM
jgi:VIT1/CCC1 family predicted Fe2+/Mn2+ transporter